MKMIVTEIKHLREERPFYADKKYKKQKKQAEIVWEMMISYRGVIYRTKMEW